MHLGMHFAVCRCRNNKWRYLEGFERIRSLRTTMPTQRLRRWTPGRSSHHDVAITELYSYHCYGNIRISCGVSPRSRPAACRTALRFDRAAWRVSAQVKIVSPFESTFGVSKARESTYEVRVHLFSPAKNVIGMLERTYEEARNGLRRANKRVKLMVLLLRSRVKSTACFPPLPRDPCNCQ